MKKLFMFAVLVIAVVLTATCALGCRVDKDPAKVRLNEVTHSVFYAPLYAAINLGFFEEEGIELELTTGHGADKVMTALLSGQADIGLMGPEATIYVFNQGQEDYVVNFAQLTQRDGSFLVARAPDSDFTWEKVRGATIIGGRPGGMPLMTLEFVLKSYGIIPGEDVEVLTHIQFPLMAGAFTGGEGDYVTLFEPVASTLEKEGLGYVVASVGEDSGLVPYTVFSARKSYIEQSPEIVQSFTNGTITISNQQIKGPSSMVGYMPQSDQLFQWRSIWKNVLLGLEVQKKVDPFTEGYVKNLLAKYGLLDFIHARPHQLSGGMRQRAALIRTLAINPEILLLDEAFSALDYQTRLIVADEVKQIIKEEHKTTILVTHDIAEAISMADRVVVLTKRPGRIKNIHRIELSCAARTPIKCREAPEFKDFFNLIWKELDIHVA